MVTEQCATLRKRLDDMSKTWSEHKKWCAQSKKDLLEGKVELFKKAGVFIEKKDLKRITATK